MLRRLAHLGLPASIFLVAIAGIALLARAPFGEVYGTILGRGANESTAAVTLYGMSKPTVEMSVAAKDHSRYIILSIEDTQAEQATLTVPNDWLLQESRGAHASSIAIYEGTGRKTLIVPMGEESADALADRPGRVELRFLASEPFTAVAFSHDALSPALFSLTHITLPAETTTRNMRIVEGSATLQL